MSLPAEPFSQRFAARPTPATRRPDEVPDSAKARLQHLIDQERQRLLPGAWSLGPRLNKALGRLASGPGSIADIDNLVRGLQWWEFYDLCEELLRCTGRPDELAAKIDAVFASEGLPYTMTPSGIEWRLSSAAEQITQDARRLLLQDPKFQGPAEQWEKALGHLARRPPDPENSIKDAVGALEGVARMISGRSSDTLGQIIKPLAEKLGMHPALAGAVSNLYGYRGDEAAIAHGATRPLDEIIPEAEMILHWTAAAIIYFVKKRSQAENP